MATPTMLVEIGLDLSSVGGPFFTFGASDDVASNPQSLFDNTDYRFGGTLLYDVTSKVQNVSINRGRSRELDRFTTGSANITFTNQDRAFDPFYTSSPYYPDIKPRRVVQISTVIAGSTAVQFTGLVEDWSLDYQVSGESDASAACADGFILFGGQQLAAHTATAQFSGARVSAILDRAEVAWPADARSITTGAQLFQADVVEDGRDVLEYLQVVEASEPGFLFMSKDNKVTFKDRNTAATIGTIIFSDAGGTAIPYTDISVSYGTELLYNRASVGFIGADSQTASNATSINEYGVVALSINGLLIRSGAAGTADAEALANYTVNKYSEPELRFDTMSVQLAALGTADQARVVGIELHDIILVEYKPNNIGTRVSKNVQVLGIRHNIEPYNHKVTFNLGSTDTAAFVLAAGTVVADYPFSIWDSSPFGL